MNSEVPAAEVKAPPEAVVRLLEPGEGAFRAAVAAALSSSSAPEHPAGRGETVEFLSDAARRSLTICPVVAAFDSDRVVASAFALESPGRAALVFTSPPGQDGPWIRVVSTVARIALHNRNLLLEMLLQPGETRRCSLLPATGFRRLTSLRYLRRPAQHRPVNKPIAPPLEWLEYSAETHPTFVDALRLSYAQSLDCPELTGFRSIDDVLDGHRAAGEFDPALWQVIHRGKVPLGVILLSRIARQPAIEIVYMGVAPEPRGQGIGDALIERAVALAHTSPSADEMATPQELVLAVDERNLPAQRLYTRWGFGPIGEREAWIATSPATRG